MAFNVHANPNERGPAALDLMLKTLMSSSEFNDLQDKHWNAISKTIPGTTPRQCQKRYKELVKECLSNQTLRSATNAAATLTKNSHGDSVEPGDQRPSRPSSGKNKGNKSDKEGSTTKSSQQRPTSADLGPVMVIHVCDEAKNLKQDFHCPRDLLIEEMKYFAEYLSTDAQRWEEVDISVHCDVQIFDWLMKFVKRTMKGSATPCNLEASNVISILISSDFLKMDNLVNKCIEFCHEHMSDIVAAPCNMNCINDKLVTRIAELFTHKEADAVKDRKDKFKSKLFQKKIERLFDAKSTSKDSPESAALLYRCGVCRKLLTPSLETQVKCLQSRMNIDRRGQLFYQHRRDPTWDVNEYLCELKAQLKTWRDVYWRVWGLVNFLPCTRCGEIFPCAELGHCKYHPETPQFEGGSAEGTYPCCGQRVLRFHPAQPNKGCKLRDHVVDIYTADGTGLDTKLQGKETVYTDLLSQREAVCIPYQRLVSVAEGDDEIDIFALDEKALGLRTNHVTQSVSDPGLGDPEWRPRLQPLTVERPVCSDEETACSEDDEVGDLEESRPRKTKNRRSRVTVDPQAILMDAPRFGSTKSRKWDSSRSLRWNQDAQREEDQTRMNHIISYLTKLRLHADKGDTRNRHREYAGGIFSRLEAQWKAINMPPPKAPNTFQIRNKPRIGSIQK